MRVLAIAALVGLSACGGNSGSGAGEFTASGYRSASSTGISTADLANVVEGHVTGAAGSTFFATGTNTEGAKAYAALGTDVDVGTAIPANTSVLFSGIWEIRSIENIVVSGDLLTGRPYVDGGVINLTADTASGSLAGASGLLRVDGTFTGTDLGGTVDYNGVPGTLDGEIGSIGAVGAFHGSNGEAVFAGGFSVD